MIRFIRLPIQPAPITINQRFPNKLKAKPDGLYRFVTISAFYQHKNLELIGDVAKVLEQKGRKNFEFVLTIKPEELERVLKGQAHITTVDQVPLKCPSLYRECDTMFLPTLAECFSASYPEAMIMNKPIITTDLGFAAVFVEMQRSISKQKMSKQLRIKSKDC